MRILRKFLIWTCSPELERPNANQEKFHYHPRKACLFSFKWCPPKWILTMNHRKRKNDVFTKIWSKKDEETSCPSFRSHLVWIIKKEIWREWEELLLLTRNFEVKHPSAKWKVMGSIPTKILIFLLHASCKEQINKNVKK